MSRIQRVRQKIFALNATNNGVFGSGQDGSKQISDNIATLMSLPAYLVGWLQATIGSRKFPPLEEFQALNRINTQQLAYIFQEGISEFEINTTYYLNSIVKKPGTYELYGSKIDDNTGNALPSTASDGNWLFLSNLSGQVQAATQTVAGILKIATDQLIREGINDSTAITPLGLNKYRFHTGNGVEHWTSVLPPGAIWGDGKTIGPVGSNATNRANADTYDLFVQWWNDCPYSGTIADPTQGQLQLFSSAGVAVARGLTADQDWNANRALAVFDTRGRSRFVRDNLGGTPAGRLSGQPFGLNGLGLGYTGGQESHSQTGPENGPHFHYNAFTIVSTASLLEDNSIAQIGQIGSGNAYVLNGATSQPNIGRSSISGTGSPHNNVPPGITCNYIFYL